MAGSTLTIAGQAVSTEDLRRLAQINYGHFTTFRVERGAVQGLDLHLARLREGHTTLFDTLFDELDLRSQLREALLGVEVASVRVTGVALDFDYRDPLKSVTPVWLISVAAANQSATFTPLTLKSYDFVRPLPQIKHVATLPLFYHRRQARIAGADDALFVDGGEEDAYVLEGTVWNIGFWDGTGVLWPMGPALRGTCEALLQRGLSALNVPQKHCSITLGQAKELTAFTANAYGLSLVASINSHTLAKAPELQQLLVDALRTQPWVKP